MRVDLVWSGVKCERTLDIGAGTSTRDVTSSEPTQRLMRAGIHAYA
jgi:hypothetical protein